MTSQKKIVFSGVGIIYNPDAVKTLNFRGIFDNKMKAKSVKMGNQNFALTDYISCKIGTVRYNTMLSYYLYAKVIAFTEFSDKTDIKNFLQEYIEFWAQNINLGTDKAKAKVARQKAIAIMREDFETLF